MAKLRLRVLLASVSLIAFTIMLTGFSRPLLAQVGTASLNGTVTDPSGLAIPSAEVNLQSMTRQAGRQTITDATGTYVFTSMLPDTYQLVVTAKGFTTKTTQNISLISGQGSTLNVTMELGASMTRVTVTEHAPLLETSTATLGSVVESSQLIDLPLLGRNFADMMLLLPGASPPNLTYFESFAPGGGGGTGGGDVGFYGQRPRDNEFTLDGAPNAELLFDGVPMYPPPETIAEMKVESGMDSGAYGWASGANINVVTKSGTNNYHADVWEYLRNGALNAREFFLPSVAPLKWNQFGFSGGGPLAIPHLLSKARAWYVFGWYEGLRIPSKSPFYTLVPTTAELEGNFSADPPIYNPYTSTVGSTGSLLSRTQFQNNQIPTGATNVCSPHPTCFDPGALLIAQTFYPTQNLATGSGPGGTDYLGTSTSSTAYDQWSTRVDHQFGQHDSFFARYSDARNDQPSVTLPNLPTLTHQRLTNIVVSDTHTFSPTFLVTARFGFQRINWTDVTSGPDAATKAGTEGAFPLAYSGLNEIPPIIISGNFDQLSQSYAYYGPENLLQWTVDSQKIVGRHTVSFGGWFMRDKFLSNNLTGTQVSFDSTPTEGLTSGTGYGLASYFLGLPSTSGRVIGSTEGAMDGKFYAGYAQDNFRATHKLTLNLGLRYDFAPPMVNAHGSGTFVWETGQYLYDLTNPITGAPANARRALIAPDYRDLQPRVGLAYQVNPLTTVRSSFAIFNDIVGENAQEYQGNRGNWPFAFPQTVGAENTGLPQYYLENPFPGPAAGSSTPLGCQQCLEVATAATRTPYVLEWSLSVQRQLTPSLLLETSYFGSHAVHQIAQILDNTAVTPGTDNYQNRQRWPQFPPYVNNGFNEFPSFYDGLSVELRKKYSHNVSYLVSYTWSKTIDVMDSLVAGAAYPFIQPTRFDISDFKGPASFDVTSRLSASYTWGIPAKTQNKLANAVVSNWAFSGIITADTGSPYFVVLCGDNANIGTVSGRCTSLPNLVGNPILSTRTPQKWFNTSAYQTPPFGTQGDAGKHGLYSDGMSNFDLSLFKRWPFMEKDNVEFRAEFFDTFNQHAFTAPGFVEDSPSNFGQISGTRQGGRQIQFALKLHF